MKVTFGFLTILHSLLAGTSIRAHERGSSLFAPSRTARQLICCQLRKLHSCTDHPFSRHLPCSQNSNQFLHEAIVEHFLWCLAPFCIKFKLHISPSPISASIFIHHQIISAQISVHICPANMMQIQFFIDSQTFTVCNPIA